MGSDFTFCPPAVPTMRSTAETHNSLRSIAWVVLSLCVGVVAVGCLLNGGDVKYSRSTNTECVKGILSLTTADSHICCDSPDTEAEWVCMASFDHYNKILSSYWALAVPLLPWFMNALLCDTRIGVSCKRLFVYGTIFAFRTVSAGGIFLSAIVLILLFRIGTVV